MKFTDKNVLEKNGRILVLFDFHFDFSRRYAMSSYFLLFRARYNIKLDLYALKRCLSHKSRI